MELIETTRGLMDVKRLQKREDLLDDENECTTTVEYCLTDCDGRAHVTGTPDGSGYFCRQHVHRSAVIILKYSVGASAGVSEE